MFARGRSETRPADCEGRAARSDSRLGRGTASAREVRNGGPYAGHHARCALPAARRAARRRAQGAAAAEPDERPSARAKARRAGSRTQAAAEQEARAQPKPAQGLAPPASCPGAVRPHGAPARRRRRDTSIGITRRISSSTDDAFIAARQFAIAPKVAGYVTAVPVTDNQHVNKGDVIAEIDQRDYRNALAQAEGQVAGAEAGIQSIDAQIATQDAQIAASQAQVTPGAGEPRTLESHVGTRQAARQSGLGDGSAGHG